MTTANRKYKDSVFVDLFSEDEKAKENFLSLYNALHGTNLQLSCPVENIRLDNIMYMNIINDVSDGGLTGIANVPLEPETGELPQIFHTVARLGVPYILMSVQPTLRDVLLGFARKVSQLRTLGVKDIILDPGFGFGKTVEDNYLLLNEMEKMQVLDLPTLVGVSRKSMIYKTVGGNADTALNGTTVLHTIALMKGANILRVHDVKEAVEVITLFNRTMSATTP